MRLKDIGTVKTREYICTFVCLFVYLSIFEVTLKPSLKFGDAFLVFPPLKARCTTGGHDYRGASLCIYL